jgi:hypothetical protein
VNKRFKILMRGVAIGISVFMISGIPETRDREISMVKFPRNIWTIRLWRCMVEIERPIGISIIRVLS